MARIHGWSPADGALHIVVENHYYKDAGPQTISVRHPTDPYVVSDVNVMNNDEIFNAATQYVRNINERLPDGHEIPNEWITQLSGGNNYEGVSKEIGHDTEFRWVPIKRSPHDDSKKFRFESFWFQRNNNTGLDSRRTLVMLASQWLVWHEPYPTNDEEITKYFLGSEFGLRVVAHEASRQSGSKKTSTLHFTSLTAVLPFGPFKMAEGDSIQAIIRYLVKNFSHEKPNTATSISVENQSLLFYLLNPDTPFSSVDPRLDGLVINGVKFGEEGDNYVVELRGRKTITRSGFKIPSEVILYYNSSINKFVEAPIESFNRLKNIPSVSASNEGDTDSYECNGHRDFIFEGDPASQVPLKEIPSGLIPTPSRTDDYFRHFRTPRVRDTDQLSDGVHFRVVPTRYVDNSVFGNSTDSASIVWMYSGFKKEDTVQSDSFSAISSYHYIKEFFGYFELFGVSAINYFRNATLPMDIHFRSGVVPGSGKDGSSVNAQVRLKPWSLNNEDSVYVARKPIPEVHLAIATRSRRDRSVWSRVKPTRAENLGFAVDKRFFWHELGHVLLLASTGELEFRFAHSPGDSLTAIASDPLSKYSKSDNEFRGLTFPFVSNTRRHDRKISKGWGWNGPFHLATSRIQYTDRLARKRYESEQILSSTLFTLYRAIGGDDLNSRGDPDRVARVCASNYSLYLIFRAINLLGSALIVPATHPDQLVSALIDADIGTGMFGGATDQSRPSRVGGCIHKVIHWVFEAHGLYTHASRVSPEIDVYIEDRRKVVSGAANEEYSPGVYTPIPLSTSGENSERAWFASEEAFSVNMARSTTTIKVGNRGRTKADNCILSLWAFHTTPNDPLPPWSRKSENNRWVEVCQPTEIESIYPGETSLVTLDLSSRFNSFRSSSKPFLLLASVTSPGDRSNIDAKSGLPCSVDDVSVPLMDLVPSDNNIGIRWCNRK